MSLTFTSIVSRFSALLIQCCLFTALSLEVRGEEKAKDEQVVVIYSIDGLAGFYFDDPKAELPNLRRLAATGVRAKGLKVSLPSSTWPSHTNLATGVHPAVHGVLGNREYDRQKREPRQVIGDAFFDKYDLLKVPAIYDIAHDKGLKTSCIFWPATKNATTIDWHFPAIRDLSIAGPSIHPTTLLDQAAAAMSYDFENEERENVWRLTMAEYIIKEHHPNLILFHVSETDKAQHANGPRSPKAYQKIKEADEQLGAFWELLQKEYPNRATILLVSDHGFAPVDKQIRPYIPLRKAGLLPENIAASNIQLVGQGGSAMIYVLDENNRDTLLEQIKAALKDVEGVTSIVGTSEFATYGMATPEQNPHGPDLLLFAEEGYAFANNTEGDRVVVKTKKRTGAHGHDPNLPNLHGVFAAWGAGIKKGIELDVIDSTQVAPTAAKLLDFTLPEPAAAPLNEILVGN